MRIRKLACLLIVFISFSLHGQTENKFIPHGRPVFLTFSNVHYSFSGDEANPAFELTRLYLGYEYFFSKSLSARANIDIGDPGVGGLQMTAYVKNAFMLYKAEKFSSRIGMTGTDAFNLIEKQWGYRYIYKTIQDEHGFNPSADLGAAFEYTPSELISFDASVMNGEGYKKVQSDSVLKYSAGITFGPLTGLKMRVYADFMKKDHMQNTLSFFAGYTYESFRVGLEYSLQKNVKMIGDHDFSGISAFASVKIAKKLSVLARYDNIWSNIMINEIDPWHYSKDGQLFMAGFEYSPVAGIRIAPVYMGWFSSDKTKPFTSTPGIHFEVRL